MKNKFYIGEEVRLLLSLGRCFSIDLHPQLGEAEYKLLRNRIPKDYSAGVYAIEEGSLVLKKILCKKV